MDHADVRRRLYDLLLERGSLSTLGDDGSAEMGALRDHLARCGPCRREMAALQATGLLLAEAAPDDMPLPAHLRERVLRAVRETGLPRQASSTAWTPTAAPSPAPMPAPMAASGEARLAPAQPTSARPRRTSRGWPGWPSRRLAAPLAAAAAIVLLAGGVLLGRDLMVQRDAATAQVAALDQVAAAAGRLLAAPDHRQVTLHDAAGAAGGTVLFDPASHELLVFSTTLAGPAAGASYDCYVDHDGTRTRLGWMEAAGGVAYWAGDLPAGTALGPGDRFVVLDGGSEAAPELSGTF